MPGAWSSLLVILPLVAEAPAPPRPTPDEFRAWFDAARDGRLAIPAAVEAEARRLRYVFVAGFGHERMPGYFAQNIKELRARGVAERAIHVIAPSSDRTIDENADDVRDRFLEAAAAGPEDLVVVAHSRGACDALAFALRRPEFVRDRVRALFLVQGPFGGTALADYVAGDGPRMDRRMPLRPRVVAGLLGRAEKAKIDRGKHGGLAGLTRDASRDFWERALDEHAGAIPVVGPKTFYVTSRTLPARLRLAQKATAWYLLTYDGPNDGIVALGDQSLPGLGTVLAVLDSGHTDLTNRYPSARASGRLRRALVEAVIMAVGRTEAAADDDEARDEGRRPRRGKRSRRAAPLEADSG